VLEKTDVRRIALEIGLPNARKKDSTGICFIGERPFREFLNRYLANDPGPIKDDHGDVIGEHVGLSFYTLGQRKGIGIGGLRRDDQADKSAHAPWFVARKDVARNTLWVVQGHDHPWLQSHDVEAADASWVAGEAPSPGVYAAKTRYRQSDSACVIEEPATASAAATTAEAKPSFKLHFDEPQWAATPGQSAVVYDGDICLGGGVISAAQAGVR
jgi:tRNA-specific 2-thiouridylase